MIIFSAVSQKSQDYLNKISSKGLAQLALAYGPKSNAAVIGILLSLLP